MGNTVEGQAGVRRATHADGHWYSPDEDVLTEQLQALLNERKGDDYPDPASVPYPIPYDEEETPPNQEKQQHPIRAIIVPHGPIQMLRSARVTAAAFRHCNPVTLSHVRSIVLLYPSHSPSLDYQLGITRADW